MVPEKSPGREENSNFIKKILSSFDNLCPSNCQVLEVSFFFLGLHPSSRFIKSSLLRWKTFVANRKTLISCLAKECIEISKKWRVRCDERIRRDAERKAQLEREREVELQRIREEEEEKKIRGYDRMDKIYAMWKKVFDGKDTEEGGEDRRPQTSVARMNHGSCLLTERHLEKNSGKYQTEETFSLNDFILKHDLKETDIQSQISAAVADGWIQFRPNHSSRNLGSHEASHASEPQQQDISGSKLVDHHVSKRPRGQRKKFSPCPVSLAAAQQRPQSTTCYQQGSRLCTRIDSDRHSEQSEQLRITTEDQILPSKNCSNCQMIPISPPNIGPVSPLIALFPQQNHHIHEVESKINEIYSEYDLELESFWKKVTQQKQRSSSRIEDGSRNTSSESRLSSKRRPKSADLSSRAHRDSLEKARRTSKVELYGYGYEDFLVEDEELIVFPERPRSSDGKSRKPILVTSHASGVKGIVGSPRRKYPEPPKSHTRSSSSSSTRPHIRKARQIEDPYNFQD